MSGMGTRRGVVVGDALLVLSVLALALALAYPRIQRSALRERVEQAVTEVQAVVDAAARFQGDRDRWPNPADAGETSADLAEYLPAGFAFDQGSYQLDFEVWEKAEEAPPVELPDTEPDARLDPRLDVRPDTAPPPPTVLFGSLAGVTVRSAEPVVLAGLLDHFGSGRSFVHSGAWTLVLVSVPGR